MKKPVIIIRSHHIGFAFGFVVMLFAAQGVKHTFTPATQLEPIEQQVGQFVPLPEFNMPNHRVQSSKEYAAFLDGLQDNIDGGKNGH
jgi:hypothetical protein